MNAVIKAHLKAMGEYFDLKPSSVDYYVNLVLPQEPEPLEEFGPEQTKAEYPFYQKQNEEEKKATN